VTDLLLAAQRTANLVKEEGQRAADEARAGAEEERAHSAQLREAAEQALQQAHRDVDVLLRDARSERERLIASMTEDASRARTELEAGNARLEAASAELHGSLANRIHEALAVLDRIELEPKRD